MLSLQGKLAVAQGKVNLKNVADDVIDLSQALVKQGVTIRNKIGADTPLVGAPRRRAEPKLSPCAHCCVNRRQARAAAASTRTGR